MKRFLILAAPIFFLIIAGAGCIKLGGKGSGAMGVFATNDKGETWKPLMAYPTARGVESIAGLKTYKMHRDPSDPNAIYLATRGQGLFYTYNKGETWQSVSALANRFIYGFAVASDDSCTLYASDGPHVLKSTDCSRNWTIIYTEERPNQRFVSLAVDFHNNDIIYGALIGGDILVSKDAGRSWRVTKRFDFELQSLEADPFSGGNIFVASQRNGLYRSRDAGFTWIDLNAGLNNFNDSMNFYRLVLNPAQRDSLFWISKYGILRSNDSGVTWGDVKLLTPPGSVNIYAFAINPKNQNEIYYTGTILGSKNEHIRSSFYKTSDGGVNWITKKLPTNSIPIQFMMNPANTSQLFVGFTTLN